MKKLALSVLLAFSCVTWVDVATTPIADVAGSAARVSPPTHITAFVETHCIACHNDRVPSGGLRLNAETFASMNEHTETWEKVLHKVRTGQMPPAPRPRPSASDAAAFTAYLQTTLDAAAERDPQPGRVGVHRLNRSEYANAIRCAVVADRRCRLAAAG
jgi:mono/diheme cytochrome c family protein